MSDKSFNRFSWSLAFKAFSLSLALMALGVRGIGPIVSFLLLFAPIIWPNAMIIILWIYDFVRPVLYIAALVNVICGVQDFIAIAFYVIFAIQIPSMIKNLICTIYLISEYRNSRK